MDDDRNDPPILLSTLSASAQPRPTPYPSTYHQVSEAGPPAHGFAVTSLVLGVLGLVGLFVIGPILALIFGYIGRSRIKESAGRYGGDGMAVAGIVLGWIGLIVNVALIMVGTTILGHFFNIT